MVNGGHGRQLADSCWFFASRGIPWSVGFFVGSERGRKLRRSKAADKNGLRSRPNLQTRQDVFSCGITCPAMRSFPACCGYWLADGRYVLNAAGVKLRPQKCSIELTSLIGTVQRQTDKGLDKLKRRYSCIVTIYVGNFQFKVLLSFFLSLQMSCTCIFTFLASVASGHSAPLSSSPLRRVCWRQTPRSRPASRHSSRHHRNSTRDPRHSSSI